MKTNYMLDDNQNTVPDPHVAALESRVEELEDQIHDIRFEARSRESELLEQIQTLKTEKSDIAAAGRVVAGWIKKGLEDSYHRLYKYPHVPGDVKRAIDVLEARHERN